MKIDWPLYDFNTIFSFEGIDLGGVASLNIDVGLTQHKIKIWRQLDVHPPYLSWSQFLAYISHVGQDLQG